MTDHPNQYLYVAADLQRTGLLTHDRLVHCSERHHLELVPPSLNGTRPWPRLSNSSVLAGTVIEMTQGWLGLKHLWVARRALATGTSVFLYWPNEKAVECIDRERLRSHWRHWVAIRSYRTFAPHVNAARNSLSILAAKASRGLHGVVDPRWSAATAKVTAPLTRIHRFHQRVRPRLRATVRLFLDENRRLARSIYLGVPYISGGREHEIATTQMQHLDRLIARAQPLAVANLLPPTPERPLAGTGIYLRTDFWAPITSGGSYGHTCYVAKALGRVTEGLTCLMANHYSLLDDLHLRQVVLPRPPGDNSEAVIIAATAHYDPMVRGALAALRAADPQFRPAYIYERLCLGNYVAPLLSQELRIPYFAEYNGSEISMKRSFQGSGYEHEALYLKAEDLAFRQATLISVISDVVKADLLARGIPEHKILVNPNGADLDAYAPLPAERKVSLRDALGWNDSHCVVGFTGTFGGWHGIDVLAAVMPEICRQRPEVRFLIIGDGQYKYLIDDAVATYQLADRVRCVGRVPQQEGCRLLGACDIYVSTHNTHMVDSRFFGSPTKIFEYMAMGGGIVATDLEQIGEVLSPALRLADLHRTDLRVDQQRAVLCTPGDVQEFAAAVAQLAARRDICTAIGDNARQAVADHYSWDRHIARLWAGATGHHDAVRQRCAAQPTRPATPVARLVTGDAYKDEAQAQWDEDPCGSHYVQEAQPETLEWFLEAERYRYQEYAPWMRETMEFANHASEDVLEIGSGIGTDLCQFAMHGACVTDVDLSAGHLELARKNFALRGLTGRFLHHDAEQLPFDDNTFDLVYSNGVLHHTPDTQAVVREIFRVLKPGGRSIVMVYAENSLHYWRNLVRDIGLRQDALCTASMGAIMSQHVELGSGAKPLVKVYTRRRLRHLFRNFQSIEIVQRQITAPELPKSLAWLPLPVAGRIMGWNLVIKARKPANGSRQRR